MWPPSRGAGVRQYKLRAPLSWILDRFLGTLRNDPTPVRCVNCGRFVRPRTPRRPPPQRPYVINPSNLGRARLRNDYWDFSLSDGSDPQARSPALSSNAEGVVILCGKFDTVFRNSSVMSNLETPSRGAVVCRVAWLGQNLVERCRCNAAMPCS
jgi:hypothetical protein